MLVYLMFLVFDADARTEDACPWLDDMALLTLGCSCRIRLCTPVVGPHDGSFRRVCLLTCPKPLGFDIQPGYWLEDR